MKKRILFILLTSITYFISAQSHEIGVLLGGSNFVGDIGSTNFIKPNNFSGGLVYKYNFNPRIAIRANYNYLPISGNDTKATNLFRQQRGASFKNNLHEIALGTEFNFFEYDISHYKKAYTPYITTQFAIVNHAAPSKLLSPNNLEFKNKFSYAIPFGIGFKGKLIDNFAFAVETVARYTFTDELDYSNEKINPILVEGSGNDWYFFTGISLVYTFGKPACYNGLTL